MHATMATHDLGSRMRRSPVADRSDTRSVAGSAGARFPFRDLVVARTYEPRADAAAMRSACVLADHMPGVAVIRAAKGLPGTTAANAVLKPIKEGAETPFFHRGTQAIRVQSRVLGKL